MFSSHLDIFQNNAIVQKVFVNGSKRKRAIAYRDGLFILVAKWNKHIRVVEGYVEKYYYVCGLQYFRK